jgi:hypothetical protein
MPTASRPSLDIDVAVFSRDPETLDGLTDYLRAAGARALPRRELKLEERADVIVLFGDDFDAASSDRFVTDWVRVPPARRCVLILVTSHTALAGSVRHDERAVVLRRPVWGWVLLAAIGSAIRDTARQASTSAPEAMGSNTNLPT